MENDYTIPQAAWSAYRDLAFGQASFVIMNETSAEWAWRADDGTPIDQVWDNGFVVQGDALFTVVYSFIGSFTS